MCLRFFLSVDPSTVLMHFQDELIKRHCPRGPRRQVYIQRGIDLQQLEYTGGSPFNAAAKEGGRGSPAKPAVHSGERRP